MKLYTELILRVSYFASQHQISCYVKYHKTTTR